MSQLPPLTDKPTVDEIHQHLSHIVQHILKPAHSFSIFQEPIGFKDGNMKANWAPYDLFFNALSIHSDFFKHPLNGATCRVGLFITSMASWVGKKWPPPKKNWDLHAWVAIVIGKPEGCKGKELVIWDPNGDKRVEELGQSRKAVLFGPQKRLVEDVGGKGGPERILYGGKGNRGSGICLDVAVEWIQHIAENGLDAE